MPEKSGVMIKQVLFFFFLAFIALSEQRHKKIVFTWVLESNGNGNFSIDNPPAMKKYKHTCLGDEWLWKLCLLWLLLSCKVLNIYFCNLSTLSRNVFRVNGEK